MVGFVDPSKSLEEEKPHRLHDIVSDLGQDIAKRMKQDFPKLRDENDMISYHLNVIKVMLLRLTRQFHQADPTRKKEFTDYICKELDSFMENVKQDIRENTNE